LELRRWRVRKGCGWNCPKGQNQRKDVLMENSTLWSAGLSLLSALILLWVNSVNNEAKRISILLSKTREENAEKYMTKNEVHGEINRVLDRLDRLENKIDLFIREQKSALN
jgi:hypothetical protein